MITPSTNVHHLFYKWNNKTVSVLLNIIYLVFKEDFYDSVLIFIPYKITIFYKMECFMKEHLFVPSIAIIYHILRELRMFCFCCKQFTKRGKISSHTFSHTLEHWNNKYYKIWKWYCGKNSPKIYFLCFLLLLLATIQKIQFLYGTLIPYVNFLTLNFWHTFLVLTHLSL